ncbi:MAG: hypothetical protein MUP63_03125 [Candidatus Nanohaloarchaeota archaeon QJJ-7]|nr:hypothetical protein [Candidatus Nanohaloarchaeota archaeon QJJ-7]
MDEVKRFGLVAVLLIGSLLIGFFSGGVSSSPDYGGKPDNYTVSGLMEKLPLKENVEVSGNVSRILNDYESDAGNVYQQFYLTDGEERVKVFCSTSSGRTNVSVDDRVRVSGEFKEFYGEYEVYTRCSSIRPE